MNILILLHLQMWHQYSQFILLLTFDKYSLKIREIQKNMEKNCILTIKIFNTFSMSCIHFTHVS